MLNLIGECRSLSYDALTAHVAIVFTRYMLLAMEQRQNEDQRTLGELFFFLVDEMADITFHRSLEEYLYRFNELSSREIDVLYLLYGCQKDWSKLSYPNENADAKKLRIWNDFKKLASKKFNISKGEVDTITAGISRTGFCKPLFVSVAKTSEIIYRATSDFFEFVKLVKENQC